MLTLVRFIVLAQLLLSATFLRAAANPPDIILILAGDLRWSDIGCYGGEIPIPNIDRLVAGGLTPTPCSPFQ